MTRYTIALCLLLSFGIGVQGGGLLAADPSSPAGDPLAKDGELDRLRSDIEDNATEVFEQREREDAMQALGRLGTPEAVDILVGLMNDPFVHIRERAILILAGVEGRDPGLQTPEAIARLIETGLGNEDPVIRLNTAICLGRFGENALVQAEADTILQYLGRERDGNVQRELTKALGWIGADTEDIVEALSRIAGRRGEARAAAVIALARLGHFDEIGRLSSVMRDVPVAMIDACVIAGQSLPEAIEEADVSSRRTEVPVKIAVVEALQTLHETDAEGAVALAVEMLSDDNWRVRAATIETMFMMWDKACIGPLIDRLGEEEGRLRLDIYFALRFYTSQDFGLESTPWRTWWNANHDRLELGRPPERGPWGVDVGAGPAMEGDENETGVAQFFEIPVLTDRAIFCFDPSGSMRDPADGIEGSPRKIDFAADQCRQTLEVMPEDARFNVMLYRYWSEFPPRTEVERVFDRLVPVNRQSASAVREFIAVLEPRGWGDFYGALTTAIQDPDVDTIFFLSDGRPSRGEHVRFDELLRHFDEANRFRRVVVNTVLTGTDGADATFMHNLAILTGGMFKMVDVD